MKSDDVIYEYGCEVTSTKLCPLRNEIRKEAVKEFAEWLDGMGYLTSYVSDDDEDLDGNRTYYGRMDWLNAIDVLSEYEKKVGV